MTGAGPTPGSAVPVPLLRWGGLALIVVLALLQLGSPFAGDQALFATMGEQLRGGDVLYVDLWDVKQPAFYLWWSAATLLGGHEVGVHVAEAVWLVGFAAVLPRLLRGHVTTARAAALAPLLSVGAYYLVSEPLDRTQAEALAGPVLFVACWWAVRSGDDDRRGLVLAGVLVGVAAMVKVTFAPMAAAGLLVVLLTGPLRGGAGRRRCRAIVGWSLLGFGLVLAVTALWLAVVGGLDEAGALLFGYLPSVGDNGLAAPNTVRHTFVRFVLMYLPIGLLAAVAVRQLQPRRWASWWGDGPPRLLLAMCTWAALAVPITVAQNGWKYLPQVAVLPLGVLAAQGVELVRGWRTAPRRGAVVAVAAGLVVALVLAAPSWRALVQHRLGWSEQDRLELGAEHELAYQRGAALRDEVPVTGDLFVLGSPLLHRVTERPLGTRIHGWTGDQLRDEEWEDLIADLDEDPPAVVVVSDPWADLPRREGQPRFWEVVHDRFCEVGGYGTDTWYVRRDLVAGALAGSPGC